MRYRGSKTPQEYYCCAAAATMPSQPKQLKKYENSRHSSQLRPTAKLRGRHVVVSWSGAHLGSRVGESYHLDRGHGVDHHLGEGVLVEGRGAKRRSLLERDLDEAMR